MIKQSVVGRGGITKKTDETGELIEFHENFLGDFWDPN